MKKNLYLLSLTASLMLTPVVAGAQCNGLRYRDFIFQDSLVSNIVYGSNVSANNSTTSLKLDIHFPKGDTATSRPLVIMAHGGNFLGGSKSGSDVLQLCTDLSKMGYVVASIDYRVGMTNFPFPGPDSTDATEAVMRAVHDARAAVRFFRKDFAMGNSYGIDTSRIFFAGVSAGGFMALHLAYLDDIAEFPAWADTTAPGLQGGLEGNSGNAGYPSNVRGVINLCGALGDTAWIKPGDEPAMLFHGDADATVPYGSDIIVLLGVYPLLQVDGSFSVAARLNQYGIENCFETYEGRDHVPHVGDAAIYDTTLNLTRNFLVRYVCGDPLNCSFTNPIGISEQHQLPALVGLFPNPASESALLDLSRLASAPRQIRIFDASGRLVETLPPVSSQRYELPTAALPAGIYMIVITGDDYSYSTLLQVTH